MSATADLLSLRVVGRERLADDVVLLSLDAATAEETLPVWTPGAHVDIATRDQDGGEVMRQYSLCGQPDQGPWRIAVLGDRNGRGGSLWLHRNAQVGCQLDARGPRNHFALVEGDEPVVLLAGGIGITPLLPMAHALHARGRAFRLHYRARSRTAAGFLPELVQVPWADRVHVAFDDEGAPEPARLFGVDDREAWVYTCGPAGFMDAVAAGAAAAGIPGTRVRRELFAAAPPDAVTLDKANAEFVVRLVRSGRDISVRSDETVAQALCAADVALVVSCEQGYCGSCLTGVLAGRPDHRDQFMLPEEHERNDAFTPCCSRSLTPVLELDL